MAAAITKLTEARLITGASPKVSASGAVISGAVILKILPQLNIEAAADRSFGGYNSESQSTQTTLAESCADQLRKCLDFLIVVKARPINVENFVPQGALRWLCPFHMRQAGSVAAAVGAI